MSPTTKTLLIAGILLWLFWPEEAHAEALPESDIMPTHGGGFQVHSSEMVATPTPTFECAPPE